MKIVVLSRSSKLYSTQRLLEAIRANGHEALLLDHMRCQIVAEQRNPAIIYEGRFLEGVDAVIPRIGASVTLYGSAVIRQFEMMNTFTTLPSQTLIRSRDKLRSLQLLSAEGLGMPKTILAYYINDPDPLIDSLGGPPLIIKQLKSTQGLGVLLAQTRLAVKFVIQAFNSHRASIIMQEFVQEAKGADIRAFVVNGQVVGAMKRQAPEGEFRSNLHRGGSSTPIKLTRPEKTAAIKAATTLGLRVAGVDMLQSRRGPLILEVNASPGLEGIEKTSGEDIAGAIVRYIEENLPKKRWPRDQIKA
jgi:ribosomal protein S6--L-glutamate ligase